MKPPSYLHLYRAGVRTMGDAALLWHLAECGVTGATTPQILAATRMNYNTIHTALSRLHDMKLVAQPSRTGQQGCANIWVLSRLGYRLITGQALAIEETFAPVTATT